MSSSEPLRLLNFIWFFNEIRKSECDTRIRKSLLP